jgi:hypothetical protein
MTSLPPTTDSAVIHSADHPITASDSQEREKNTSPQNEPLENIEHCTVLGYN